MEGAVSPSSDQNHDDAGHAAEDPSLAQTGGRMKLVKPQPGSYQVKNDDGVVVGRIEQVSPARWLWWLEPGWFWTEADRQSGINRAKGVEPTLREAERELVRLHGNSEKWERVK